MHSSLQLLQLSRQNILLGSLINVCFLLSDQPLTIVYLATVRVDFRQHYSYGSPAFFFFFGKDNMNSLILLGILDLENLAQRATQRRDEAT